MDAVARLSGVTKSFGEERPALADVSLEISPGTLTGLVGPDAAGKTTLIRLLTGLMLPDTGCVEVLGHDTRSDASAIQSTIGYMPQRFGLYEDLSVMENLRLYADLRGVAPDTRSATFARLLEFTDLARFRDRLAGKLSGGMKQKLGLACALVETPTLLLLDEPGVGVDPISRRELWRMVGELTGEGIAVLWSTAYLDEAERCGMVHLLNEGNLLFSGPPRELTDRVDGRVLRVPSPPAERRERLALLLDRDGVADATIEGETVRMLLAGDAAGRSAGHAVARESAAQPARPRFEDGFMDLLGGVRTGGRSALAAEYREIPRTGRPQIEARALTKRFGDFTAACDIDFEVPQGRIFGLLGPNGAGKSTTFKMLCGLLTPTSGDGTVAGIDLRSARAEARNSLGYMAQKFSLYGDLSVQQNLRFFAGAYGLTGRAAKDRVDRTIALFALEPFLERNSGSLPLGFKQRLALACAVLHEPPVLFLDEPTSGVDPLARREFWTHINGLVGRGVTVLVTTHFMDEAEYCDEIALIYRSAMIARGTPDDLKRQAGEDGRDTTLEDAFIELIERSDRDRERNDLAAA